MEHQEAGYLVTWVLRHLACNVGVISPKGGLRRNPISVGGHKLTRAENSAIMQRTMKTLRREKAERAQCLECKNRHDEKAQKLKCYYMTIESVRLDQCQDIDDEAESRK